MRLVTGSLVFAALFAIAWAGSARAEVIQIKIKDLVFTPALTTAHVGDTVEWVNGDFVAHTATARNGAWDVLIPPNSSKGVVVKSAGVIEYYCKVHPQMTGTIRISR